MDAPPVQMPPIECGDYAWTSVSPNFGSGPGPNPWWPQSLVAPCPGASCCFSLCLTSKAEVTVLCRRLLKEFSLEHLAYRKCSQRWFFCHCLDPARAAGDVPGAMGILEFHSLEGPRVTLWWSTPNNIENPLRGPYFTDDRSLWQPREGERHL